MLLPIASRLIKANTARGFCQNPLVPQLEVNVAQSVQIVAFKKSGEIHIVDKHPTRVFNSMDGEEHLLGLMVSVLEATIRALGQEPLVHYLEPRDGSSLSAPFRLDQELYAYEGISEPLVDFNLEFESVNAVIEYALAHKIERFEILNRWSNTVWSV
jgi:hypothetical protein